MAGGKSLNLRQAANGESCVLCGTADGSVILHHTRVGQAGMGQKPKDFPWGVCLCSACHSYVHGEGRADYRTMLIALGRQMERYVEAGVITLK